MSEVEVMAEVGEAPPSNGAAEEPKQPQFAWCEGCEGRVHVADLRASDGKRSHLVPAGRKGHTMRWCGPVKVAYVYLLGYVVRFPGQPEKTERTDAAMPGPLSAIQDIEALEAQLVKRETAKAKAVDIATGRDLIGAPDPVVRITSYQLMRSV